MTSGLGPTNFSQRRMRVSLCEAIQGVTLPFCSTHNEAGLLDVAGELSILGKEAVSLWGGQ